MSEITEDYLGASTPKLGFGFMRLPKLEDGEIDLGQTCEMVDHFMDAGLTYFDTAYVYGNGASEAALRASLVDRYPRDRFTVATKMCAWQQADDADAAKGQFYTSLERTGAGYFDYYLLHALQAGNFDKYDEYGLWDFVAQRKAEGLVRHAGFSFHAGPELLDRLLGEHPEVDFVQLQLNYADWENPDVQARANYEVARAHGVPIVVMEPVKGGALADPVPEVRRVLEEAEPGASLASWAIRYAASLDGIITVLSGMSTLAQVDDNISYMRDFKPLDDRELDVVREAQRVLSEIESIPCTACRYCTGGCPRHIPIPDIFAARNRQLVWNQVARGREDYEKAVGADGAGRASDCIACGQCEAACPQQIHVVDWLRDCAAALEG